MRKWFKNFYGVGLMLVFLMTGCFSEKTATLNETVEGAEEVKYEESISNTSASLSTSLNNHQEKEGIKIYFKSNFKKTFAYYKTLKTWTELPGVELSDSTNKPGYKELVVSSKVISVMINDGNGNWDSIGKKKVMYIIAGKGEFIIEDHKISKIKALKSNYDSMNVKGEFSENLSVSMKLIADYTWETTIYGNTSFSFDVLGDGTKVFGDNENDGIADANGSPIMLDNNKYKVTFNEKTKAYKAEKQEILPQIVKNYKASVDANYNVTIQVTSPMPEKPDGVRIYKSLTRDGKFEMVSQIEYSRPKWQEEFNIVMSLKNIGNENGLVYYMIKSYVGDKESEPSEITELKVNAYHDPLSKLENFTVTKYGDNVSFNCSYSYITKPEGIRIYKSFSKNGKYEMYRDAKFNSNSISVFLWTCTNELGNSEGFAYYYAVPYIGDKEGIPTDVVEMKVLPSHDPLSKLENFTATKYGDNVSFNCSYSYITKPEGIRIYKSLSKNGKYEIYRDAKFNSNSINLFLWTCMNELGSPEGFAYYYAVPYIGTKEGIPTDIVEMKVFPSHDPLSKLEKFTVTKTTNGYVSFGCSYNYFTKPTGIRVYKSLSREGVYSIYTDWKFKFSNTGQFEYFGAISTNEICNLEGYAYYYAVPYIGDKEGIPTDIIEVKVK